MRSHLDIRDDSLGDTETGGTRGNGVGVGGTVDVVGVYKESGFEVGRSNRRSLDGVEKKPYLKIMDEY